MISNYIVPGVFLIIVIVSGIIGLKKGFIKQLAGIASFIVGGFLAYKFCEPLSQWIRTMPFIQSMMSDVEMPDFSTSATLWDKITTLLNYMMEGVQNSGDVSSQANQILNNYMAVALSYIIAFLGVFAIVVLIIKLLALIITRAMKDTALNPVNKVLGVVLGVLEGFFSTWLLSHFFASTILPWLANSYPDAFSMEMVDTIFYKLFLDFNPMSLLMNWITSW
ncbi:MAG: CvpA family protein [Clostridiales bacterium]|nr:CvpA family protein [Clostridiales bacterium]